MENQTFESGPSQSAGDMANQAKEKLSEFGRTAAQKMDDGRVKTAEALHDSAQSVRSAGKTSGEAISGAANKTADTLEGTARYLRNNDFGAMLKEVQDLVRRNPGPSLVAAVAVGFLAGSAMRSRS